MLSHQSSGQKLLDMLRANGGSTAKMEVDIEREQLEQLDKDQGGGWYTKSQLMTQFNYTQTFVCTLFQLNVDKNISYNIHQQSFFSKVWLLHVPKIQGTWPTTPLLGHRHSPDVSGSTRCTGQRRHVLPSLRRSTWRTGPLPRWKPTPGLKPKSLNFNRMQRLSDFQPKKLTSSTLDFISGLGFHHGYPERFWTEPGSCWHRSSPKSTWWSPSSGDAEQMWKLQVLRQHFSSNLTMVHHHPLIAHGLLLEAELPNDQPECNVVVFAASVRCHFGEEDRYGWRDAGTASFSLLQSG